MSGCAVCVYDLYVEAKAVYSKELAGALTILQERRVPKELWPQEIVKLAESSKPNSATSSGSFEDDGPLDATMKAFVELEKRLKGNS